MTKKYIKNNRSNLYIENEQKLINYYFYINKSSPEYFWKLDPIC